MRYHIKDRAQASTLFPDARVDIPCEIGDDTNIWRNTHISAGAVIGSNCMIGQGVHVGPGVKIGDGCRIQNGAQLFEGVTLEENVFIGPHVVFTNVLTPRAHVKRADAFDLTTVRRGASIGANSTILCGIEIGEYAMVGAGTVVTKPVIRHALVHGNPAHHHGGWVCVCGEKLFHLACPKCHSKYRVDKDGPYLEDDAKAHP